MEESYDTLKRRLTIEKSHMFLHSFWQAFSNQPWLRAPKGKDSWMIDPTRAAELQLLGLEEQNMLKFMNGGKGMAKVVTETTGVVSKELMVEQQKYPIFEVLHLQQIYRVFERC